MAALAASEGPQPRAPSALLFARFLVFAGSQQRGRGHGGEVLGELGEGDADLELQLEAALITAARADVGLREVAEEHLDRVRPAASENSHAGGPVAVQCAYAATALGHSVEEASNPLAPRSPAGGCSTRLR